MGVVALVVLEPGSNWPDLGGDYDRVIALAGDAGTLLERTRERLASIATGKDRLVTAIVGCCAMAEDTIKRRAKLARLLFDALERKGRGKLVLASRPDAPPLLREELLSLASMISCSGRTIVRVAPEPLRRPNLAWTRRPPRMISTSA